jgi:hypothetical protein
VNDPSCRICGGQTCVHGEGSPSAEDLELMRLRTRVRELEAVNGPVLLAVLVAIREEREACAVLVESLIGSGGTRHDFAAAIRARGVDPKPTEE